LATRPTLDGYRQRLVDLLIFRLRLADDNYNYPLMTIRNAH
jgi:hypothetical protein